MTTAEKQTDSEEAIDLGVNVQAPTVLIVSSNANYSLLLSCNLFDIGISTRSLTVQAELDAAEIIKLHPNIAFVDWDLPTANQSPFYLTLGGAVPDCKIVILCTREQSSGAADAIRGGKAFDYLLTDSEADPDRLRLLLERTQLDAVLPKPEEIRKLAKHYNRRSLELLKEIKSILKSDLSNPVVKAIHDFDKSSRDASGGDESTGDDLAEKYRNNLVDVLCGKLRRLESEVGSHGRKHAHETGKSLGSILIVEDDIVSAELARRILERHGYDVVIAGTDNEAIHDLSLQRFQVVLMDVHLGAGDGLRIVRMMRTRTDLQVVPVIVITSDRQRDTLYEAAELKIQGYLLKPYRPKELLDKVKNAICSGPKSNSASGSPVATS